MGKRHLLVVFFMGLYFSMIGQTSFGDNKEAGHYIKIRGINMYYEEYGQGEPLLFIHGNGGSITAFFENIPFFAKHYRVIAVDSRAQGKTIDTQDSLTFEMMADDFSGLLDALHIDSSYVVGWSDGGINGLLLAIRHPEKVKKLAVTGANLWPDTTGLTPFVWNDIVTTVARLKTQKQTPEVKNSLKIANLDMMEPHMTLEELHSIQCPVLVICGDHDAIPVRHTVDIAQNISHSYLWVIPESGHSTPIVKKDQFNAIVSHFFATPYREIKGSDTYR